MTDPRVALIPEDRMSLEQLAHALKSSGGHPRILFCLDKGKIIFTKGEGNQ